MQEACVLFLHLHVPVELITMFEFGESTGKLGLKMTNRTHTDEKKMVQLYYFVSGCVISMLIFLFINRSRLYGQVRKH